MAHEPPARGSRGPAVAQAPPLPGVAAVRPVPASLNAPSAEAAPEPRTRSLYAALDLGTNNCRLLVARPDGSGFRVVDAFSRIVRLGEGLGHTGRLSPAAMDRAVEALKVCHDKLADRRVARVRLIATEACRAAANGDEFLERVERDAGLRLEVVDRETEARLAAQGCAPLVDPRADGVILFDIGGGSSEIVWLAPRHPGKQGGPMAADVRAWTSLPVGVVTLAERHGGREVGRAEFKAMVDEVEPMVRAFAARARLPERRNAVHLLGTSGTVTTLAGLHLGLPRYDRRRVDGLWMDRTEIDRSMETLLSMNWQARVANACIGAERADLVLAGCAILEAIRVHFPLDRLRVADRGLREGILVGLMREDGVWRRPPHGELRR